jgi:hypothetical protein
MTDTPSDPTVYARQGKAWSAEEDRHLYDAFAGGDSIDTLSTTHKGSAGGIRARLSRLGLIDENGRTVEPLPPFAGITRREDAASGAQRSAPEEDAIPSVFGVKTGDGWVGDIRSNQPLTKSFVDRLMSMLQGIVQQD